jgi:hypothetical protein
MLLTVGFVETDQDPVVEYDSYVPLTLTWPRYQRSLEPPTTVVLRSSRGYLEVKLNAQDGELVELVVPSAAATDDSITDVAWPTSGERCVPVIAALPGNGTVDAPDLRFDGYRNCLKIGLSDKGEQYFVGAGPVLFGIDEDSCIASMLLEWDSAAREEFLSSCFLVSPP